jgi:hypothetical protein
MPPPNNFDIDLLATNFASIKPDLYAICIFYCQNQLPYLKQPDQKSLEYIDFATGQSLIIPANCNFDCFQFVWFILKKLVESKVIKSEITEYQQTFDTIIKFTTAKENGFLVDFQGQSDLQSCGLVFFTITPGGMTQYGQRHMGFYFLDQDKVEFVSNRSSRGGVVNDNYSKSEFAKILQDFPVCWISKS